MKSTRFLTCAILVLSSTAFSMQRASSDDKRNEMPAQGEPLGCTFPAAYNAPASIDVNNKDMKYMPSDLRTFIEGTFIYWYAGEEGLTVANNGVFSSPDMYFTPNTTTLFQTSNYAPGFKVKAGVVHDHQTVVYAEYTWYRSSNSMNSGAALSGTALTSGTSATFSGTPVWVVDDWFLQGTTAGQALSGSAVSSTWKLSMDIIDAAVSRPFYQSRRVVIAPFAGLRSALIRQSMVVNLTEATALFGGALTGSAPPQPIMSHNHSNSWSIGPRVGMDTQYLLPMGFRFEGDFAASLLYTQYTSVKHSESPASTLFNAGPYVTSYKNYSCLRPAAELGLGFGWGKYLYNREYHIDFSADYDFMVFWSQNMMRKLLDDTLTGTSPSASELFLHGVTFKARFDY